MLCPVTRECAATPEGPPDLLQRVNSLDGIEGLIDNLRDVGALGRADGRVLVVTRRPQKLVSALSRAWSVRVAQSPTDALECVGQWKPHVVIAADPIDQLSAAALLEVVGEVSPSSHRILIGAELALAHVAEQTLLHPVDLLEFRTIVSDAVTMATRDALLCSAIETVRSVQEEGRRARSDLRRTERLLCAADSLTTLGRLTSGLTHEIRNQLAVASVLVETVEEDVAAPDIQEASRHAREAVRTLIRCVQHVNAFAKRERSDAPIKEIAVGPFVDELLTLFRLTEIGASHEVKVDIPAGARTVFVDPRGLGQGLLALLTNAARASAGGEPIELLASRNSRSLVFTVRDRGVGMDATTLRKAQRPFFSAFKPSGLGMGLEIARVVAEGHGGRLLLTSTLGEGTVAKLSVPNGLESEAP